MSAGSHALLAPGYRFPWRAGNRLELLVDGAAFYPRMLAAIASARRYVLLEMYLVESGRVADSFIHAFSAAAARGVEVLLLLDDYGALALSAGDRERLARAGVRLCFYNRLHFGKLFANLARDHRKLMIVDGVIAYTGGAGIGDPFDAAGGARPSWHETMTAIEGPVVGDWQELFRQVWSRHGDAPFSAPAAPPQAIEDGSRARVIVTQSPRRGEIQRALIKRIRSAERRAWVMTAYFVPSWRLRRALKRAARRRVDVRLLLPGPRTDHPAVRHAGRRYYGRLLAQGVRIYEFQPRFLHAKLALVDDWALVGSSNLDRWNLRWNLEANLEIDGGSFPAAVAALFERDFGESLEWNDARWRARPWIARLRERAWGVVDRLLHRIGRGRQDEV